MKSDNNCVKCFFCSNSIIKSLFLRLDQSVNARLRALTFSIATGTSNSSCSDSLTLPISDWFLHSEGGASCDRTAILSVAFSPIQNYMSDTSWVFYSLCDYNTVSVKVNQSKTQTRQIHCVRQTENKESQKLNST